MRLLRQQNFNHDNLRPAVIVSVRRRMCKMNECLPKVRPDIDTIFGNGFLERLQITCVELDPVVVVYNVRMITPGYIRILLISGVRLGGLRYFLAQARLALDGISLVVSWNLAAAHILSHKYWHLVPVMDVIEKFSQSPRDVTEPIQRGCRQ